MTAGAQPDPDVDVTDLRQHIQAVSQLLAAEAFLAARDAFLASIGDRAAASSSGLLSPQELLEAQDRVFGFGSSSCGTRVIATPSSAAASKVEREANNNLEDIHSEESFSTDCPSEILSHISGNSPLPSNELASGWAWPAATSWGEGIQSSREPFEDWEQATGPAAYAIGPCRPGSRRADKIRSGVASRSRAAPSAHRVFSRVRRH